MDAQITEGFASALLEDYGIDLLLGENGQYCYKNGPKEDDVLYFELTVDGLASVLNVAPSEIRKFLEESQREMIKVNKVITVQIWLTDEVPAEIQEDIEDQCKGRAFDMLKEGYQSGELCEMYDDVEYSGWWSKTEVDVIKPKDKIMKDILDAIGSTRRDEAMDMIVDAGYSLERVFEALDGAAMGNQVLSMYRIAMRRGLLTEVPAASVFGQDVQGESVASIKP